MLSAQLDQFSQALMGKIAPLVILGAVLVVLVGLPVYWFRLKLEPGLIRAIRSARSKRQIGKSTTNANESAGAPHCPVCNALMVKRLARRGSGAGSTFWGCNNYPSCRGTRAI
jgi:hypothetical protein